MTKATGLLLTKHSCASTLSVEDARFSRRKFLKVAGGIVVAYTVLGSLDDVFADPEVKVETVVNNGPSELRYDLVWMPEGYTVKEQAKFNKDFEAIIKASEKRKFFKEYGNLFNWHRIWVPSENAWTKSGGTGTVFDIEDKEGQIMVNNKQKMKELSGKAKTDLPCILVNAAARLGYTTQEFLIADLNFNSAIHELGHGIGALEDEYDKSIDKRSKGINTSIDEKNPPWKKLVDNKVKGIGVYQCKDFNGKVIPGYFKGEEAKCLMEAVGEDMDYGILCTNGMILGLRKEIGVIASAPAEGVISVKKNVPVGIVLETLASRTYIPTVKAGYASGTPEEMDALAGQLRAGKLSVDSFADKTKYKSATMANVKNKSTLTDKLGPGSYVVAVVVQDSNPAILLDPNGVTRAQRVYRVDVGTDK
ncbi:MAG: M64 family metallopeptidase [Planctomycetota bacterium]